MLRFLPLLAASLAFAQQYTITTVAGGAPPATPWPAPHISIGQPRRITLDTAGNLYFSSSNNCVFEMNSAGTLTLVAGNSRAGFSGDGGPATSAQLNAPQGLAFDAAGNLYIADSANNRIRVVSPQGVITTFAGNGSVSPGGGPGAYGDGGAATSANLHLPMGVDVDASGNVYIADTGDNLVRIVTTGGIINSFAGDSYGSYGGDAGAATSAELHNPSDVILDSKGNVYIADTANALVRQVTTDGIMHTFAGKPGTIGFSGDNGPATSAGLLAPVALALDSSGNLFFAEQGDSRIRKVDTSGNITTVAGNGTANFAGDGGQATIAQLNSPSGLAVDSSGNLYIADSVNLRIRKVASGTISTVAGNGFLSSSGDNGPAINAQMDSPQGVAVDSAGNLYIADTANNVVRRVTRDGIIVRFAGNGTAGFGGDNGAAAGAQLSTPLGLAVSASGNVYIADALNGRVRAVSPAGTITSAGGSTSLGTPAGVAVDASGNLFVADFANHRVRKVAADGTVSTVAGSGSQGYAGDGGPATSAQLNLPRGVAVDAAGNLYIADTGNNVVRRVDTKGTISTIAGNGAAGFTGDGGLATLAQITNPVAIAVDAAGGVYVTDGAVRVRKFFPGGPITTIAGNGTRGYSGDGGLATSAQISGPSAIAVDAAGNVYLADTANNSVRMLQPSGSGVSIGAVVNGASNQTGAIAPGEVIVIYGSGLGTGSLVQAQLDANGLLPTSLAGTVVLVSGVAAPVLYTSANQVAAIVPFELTGLNAQVFVLYQGQPAAPATLGVTATAPAIFTANASGTGQALALNVADGSLNGPNHPAKAGDYVTVYVTGAGQTDPPGQNGAPAAAPLPVPKAPVTATIGGKTANVAASDALGIVHGVVQVNLQVPSGLSAGAVPVVVQIGGPSSQSGVTIWVQ